MAYPVKYPEIYAELARQGKLKKDLAAVLGITAGGLGYKQSQGTNGDFTASEMKKICIYLGRTVYDLFGFERTG